MVFTALRCSIDSLAGDAMNQYMVIKQNDEFVMHRYNWQRLIRISKDGDVTGIWMTKGINKTNALMLLYKRFEQTPEKVVNLTTELFTMNLDLLEKQAILQALKRTKYEQKEAAKLMGISPRTLNYKINKHGIEYHKWRANIPINGGK